MASLIGVIFGLLLYAGFWISVIYIVLRMIKKMFQK